MFLSTDAGGVGLNLQAASAVLNMDQPWNPAVLEQHIGRVHRLGQTRPVQVMHFVARDTIEQGMLDVIKFKRSLFAGMLDGDQDSVFMGGTRLKKFIDGVEAATSAIPNGDGAPPAELPTPVPEVVSAEPVPRLSTPSAPVVETLVGLGQGFLGSLSTPTTSHTAAVAKSAWGVETDAAAGQTCLKLPVPSADLLAQAGQFIAALAARSRARRSRASAGPRAHPSLKRLRRGRSPSAGAGCGLTTGQQFSPGPGRQQPSTQPSQLVDVRDGVEPGDRGLVWRTKLVGALLKQLFVAALGYALGHAVGPPLLDRVLVHPRLFLDQPLQ